MTGYFSRMESQEFEEIILFHDRESGLKAVVALHNTVAGPALGGTRMWTYPSEEAAIEDVMRLARGMTYKAAAAELPLGGGKGVIIGDHRREKNEALLKAYARCVNKIGGRFITAEDMGIDEDDLDVMRSETSYILGGSEFGSPSPFTAYGVWCGIKACVAEVYGSPSLAGLTVAIQGVGGVGGCLCQYLANDGARLVVTDLDPEKVKTVVELWGARAVAPAEIYDQECDIFTPCGEGAIINEATLPRLKCRIVAGSANNVLKDGAAGEELRRRGILYAPDYVINAGGLIFVDANRRGITDPAAIRQIIARIETRLATLFKRAAELNETPESLADRTAEERFRGGADTAHSSRA